MEESINEGNWEETMVKPSADTGGREADEKLEERFQKLKQITLKLKKKATSQTEEIERLKDEKNKLTEKTQRVSTIQQEFDKAQDEIERLKKMESTSLKDLRTTVEENVRLKEANLENLSQINTLTSSHKFMREKLEKLENSEEELHKWKARVEELESGLKDAKQTEIDAMQEKRQTAIMSLEITDYERKLQIAKDELDEKVRSLERQVELCEQKDKSILSLEEKVSELENNAEDLRRVRDNLQGEVLRKSEKISFQQDELSKSNEKLAEKKSEMTKITREFENTKFCFSSESKVLVERCTGLEKTISANDHKISVLEENRRSRESHISNLKLELQQVESEFSNYKVKALAMLKTQKPSLTNLKETDELENLQKIVQNFYSEISILKSEIQTLKLENENLLTEKAELILRMNQAKIDSLEKEVAVGNELTKLRQNIRIKDSELKRCLDEFKIEKEAAILSYKSQLESLKTVYESKLRTLNEEVSSLRTSAELNLFLETNTRSIAEEESNTRSVADIPLSLRRIISGSGTKLVTTSNGLDQPLTIDTSPSMTYDQLRMLPRGECEGSESVSSTPLVQHADQYKYNISFEQLLSPSFDSMSKNRSGTEIENKGFERNLKDELIRCQGQIKHLTLLLRESESNCERLTQLSDTLKEEIRRVERDRERQEHLKENTEYLKNVLLKFLTLQGEDERKRLIPVLKTMLTLTPDEVSRLENSVKGTDYSNNKDNVNTLGWSSYLPTWPSGGK